MGLERSGDGGCVVVCRMLCFTTGLKGCPPPSHHPLHANNFFFHFIIQGWQAHVLLPPATFCSGSFFSMRSSKQHSHELACISAQRTLVNDWLGQTLPQTAAAPNARLGQKTDTSFGQLSNPLKGSKNTLRDTTGYKSALPHQILFQGTHFLPGELVQKIWPEQSGWH